VDRNGAGLNMSPATDFDIYTDDDGTNYLVGQTTRLLFAIDLSQIDPNLPLGKTQRVVTQRGSAVPLPGANAAGPGGVFDNFSLTGGVFDIAIPPK
jgi:hypothetical protein